MLAPRYSRVETTLGPAWFAYNERGVVLLSHVRGERAFLDEAVAVLGVQPVRRDPPQWFMRRLRASLKKGDGSCVDFASLPPFQRRVLEATSRIPFGTTQSYGDIAHTIGAPRAQRAVGTALARNPIPLMIPCHRVVRSDGTLGAYGIGGEARKRALLAREGYRAS